MKYKISTEKHMKHIYDIRETVEMAIRHQFL